MSNILLLVHRIPFPPDKGDKIRSYHLLRYLSQEHRVFLGAFVDDPKDWQHLEHLKKHCEDVFLRPIGGWRSILAGILGIFGMRALSVSYYRDSAMRRWVESRISDGSIDAILTFSSAMAQYVPREAASKMPVVADFVDVDSDKWRQYVHESGWPRSLLYRYEAFTLAKWERRILQRVSAVTLVSQTETRLLADRAGEARSKISVVRNGVDSGFFDPTLELENPYGSVGPVVVFTGAMDYFANVDGVRWFTRSIWPTVKAAMPTAQFYIVGSNPTRDVRALGAVEGVTVTGRVHDIRGYLKYASAAVAPLRLARGVQNKVLEALAMNLPVVSAPQAAQGLDGVLPESLRVAEEPDFANDLMATLNAKNGRVSDGRQYVRSYYDWGNNLRAVGALLAPVRTEERREYHSQ